ncbi:MAG: hypothetical protein WCH65_03490 [bacterium]
MKKNYQELFYEANKTLFETYEKTNQISFGALFLTGTLWFVLLTPLIFYFLYSTCFPQAETEQERILYVVIISLFFGGVISFLGIGPALLTLYKEKKLQTIRKQIVYQSDLFARSVLFEHIVRQLSKSFLITSKENDVIMQIINDNCWIAYSDYSFDPNYVCVDTIINTNTFKMKIPTEMSYFLTSWEISEDMIYTFTFKKKLENGSWEELKEIFN